MIKTENQDETDFTKALRVISEHCSNKNIEVFADLKRKNY